MQDKFIQNLSFQCFIYKEELMTCISYVSKLQRFMLSKAQNEFLVVGLLVYEVTYSTRSKSTILRSGYFLHQCGLQMT